MVDAPAPASHEPPWVAHAIWWQVYPLGFTGADASGASRTPGRGLRQLIDWLDYAVALGASGLALGPVFASATHGYDTVDHLRIDPRLGDDCDFDALVAAAHDRGLRVLLDGVFNHVGREHEAFREVLRDGPGAGRASWFRLRWPDGAGPGTEPGYADFEGHRALVALNHDEPAVADHVTDVLRHWLDRGADGWRLDAAYAVPAAFWRTVLGRLRETHPDAYVVGEVIHGDYARVVADTGMDAVTQYELWKAVWSSLDDRNFFELAHALQRHDGYLDTFAPLTFVGNHDVTRIASRLTDARHVDHALVVLCTVGGTPSIYYGDEQGLRAVKEERAGGDDAIRPAYPPRPTDLDTGGSAVYRLHQDLLALRRRHPWLHTARTSQVSLTNETFVYDVSDGEHRLRVHLSTADRPTRHACTADAPLLAGWDVGVHDGELRLPAHGWAITD